jgi:hypothetical protein
MMLKHLSWAALLLLALTASGCETASQQANASADQAMYRPITYANAAKQGPELIVIPGEIKSANAAFTQKYGANNIADFGEIELTKANFRVLERTDLGPMLEEIALAANMGNPEGLKKLKRGKFKNTNWFVRFDILKAEPVAEVKKGFDGHALGMVAGGVLGQTVGYGSGVAAYGVASSIKTESAAGIWIIGLRYKIMDANTGAQVASNYFEEKMELGAQSTSVMGVSQSQSSTITLDTLTQRLVQKAVADIDMKK